MQNHSSFFELSFEIRFRSVEIRCISLFPIKIRAFLLSCFFCVRLSPLCCCWRVWFRYAISSSRCFAVPFFLSSFFFLFLCWPLGWADAGVWRFDAVIVVIRVCFCIWTLQHSPVSFVITLCALPLDSCKCESRTPTAVAAMHKYKRNWKKMMWQVPDQRTLYFSIQFFAHF